MIYLRSFKLSSLSDRNPNAYPYNVLRKLTGEAIVFNRVTVLYGSNGSGKSTLLNLIANKLSITGAESYNPAYGKYSLQYLAECSYDLEEQLDGGSCQIPADSLYLKSEDILYEIKKIQQEAILREGYVYQQAKLGYTKEQLDDLKRSQKLYQQIEIMKFANEKYSNGETSMQLFDKHLVPNALYLLDEPETSLSPVNQLKLAEEINNLARYFDCQFIIASHSPFMLGTLEAIIYNLDAPQLRVTQWTELEHVRMFYDFFQDRKHEFD